MKSILDPSLSIYKIDSYCNEWSSFSPNIQTLEFYRYVKEKQSYFIHTSKFCLKVFWQWRPHAKLSFIWIISSSFTIIQLARRSLTSEMLSCFPYKKSMMLKHELCRYGVVCYQFYLSISVLTYELIRQFPFALLL